MNRRFAIRACSMALLLALSSPRAGAIDLAEGKGTISGYGYWGYGRTNGNEYLLGDHLGQYENAGVSFALLARPAENVVVGGQFTLAVPSGIEPDDVEIDWAFGEYRISDLFRVRAGKLKLPLGISFETSRVGTLRPFFTLPTGIYGPTNMGAEAFLGVGATGRGDLDEGWALSYDAYGGALTVEVIPPEDIAAMAQGGPVPTAEGEQVRDVFGGRLILETPVDGLTFRVSGFHGTIADENKPVVVYGLSAEYLTETWSIRAEAFRENEFGVETNEAAYLEVAYHIDPHWQVAVRGEGGQVFRAEVLDAPSSINHHLEGALGLNYWVSPSLVFKASYHEVDGNRFALPQPGQPFDPRTRLFILGSQFSF